MAGIDIAKILKEGTLTLLIAFLSLVIVSISISAFGINPVSIISLNFQGAFGSINAISKTVGIATPLLFTGLAAAIAFKNNLMNVGMEGQMYLGAVAATYIGTTLGDMFGVLPTIFVASFAAGAIGGLIPAFLKFKFNVNEVVSTMLLNYVFVLFVSMLLYGPMKDPIAQVFPFSAYISKSSYLPLLVPQTEISVGLIISIVLSVLVLIVLTKTVFGYKLAAIGKNPVCANYAGINITKNMVILFMLSGGIAGLAGMSEVCGTYHRLMEGFSANYGYLGITVAILGGLHPLGVIFGAFLVSFLITGGKAASYGLNLSVYFAYFSLTLVMLLYVMITTWRKQGKIGTFLRERKWKSKS